MTFIALKPYLDSLASLSKETSLFITAINVAVTDILYMAALIAMKQWEGITLLAGRLSCRAIQQEEARSSI